MNHNHPPKKTRDNSRPSIGWMLVVQLQSSAIPVVLLLLLLLLWLPLPTNPSFMTGITPIHGFTVSVLVVSQRPTTVVTKRNRNAILPTATTVLRSTSSRTNNEVLVTSTSTIEPTGTVVDVPSYRSVIDDSHQENMKQERNMNQIWMFRNTFPISYDHYNRSTTSTTESSVSTSTTTTTKILLLNGFGMGTFHQHRLMNEMMTHTNHHHHHLELYAMDYLGQGQSWPTLNGPTEQQGLQYSAHTWMEQIIQFIEQVMLCVMADDNNNNNSNNKEISTKVHLVGNSLGGYLATYVAATRPDLIASLILLNATPIWGLDLPGWSGHLPVPLLPKRIGHFLFDVMRATNTIQQFLNITYVNDPTVYHPTLVHEIQSCTNGPFGHDAFASILWSPPLSIACEPMPPTNIATTTSTTNFYDCIEQVQCHVLLCYGQKDPWCKPAFAKQILQRLSQQQPPPPGTSSPHHNMYHYVELSNVGHCPNHEAPIATAMVLTKWLQQQQQQQSQWTNQENINQCLFDGKQPVVVEETWGTTIVQERNANEIPLDWLDQIAVAML